MFGLFLCENTSFSPLHDAGNKLSFIIYKITLCEAVFFVSSFPSVQVFFYVLEFIEHGN